MKDEIQVSKGGSIYPSLPDSIRKRMIRAIDDVLGIRADGTLRGWIYSGSEQYIFHYRLLGLPEDAIAGRVAGVLDSILSYRRENGFSEGIAGLVPLLTGISDPTLVRGDDFQSKYNLAALRQIKDRIGIRDINDYDYLKLDMTIMETAAAMAFLVGDSKRASELLMHMVRLSDFDAAYKTAENYGSDDALINIGLNALDDFFSGKNGYHPNYLWDGIESLKRAQKDGKKKAENILYDLAMEINTERFIERAVAEMDDDTTKYFRRQMVVEGLRSLRNTGERLSIKEIDSSKVDYVTRVTDPKVITEIRRLAELSFTSEKPDYEEIVKSLSAIGDNDTLNHYGDELFDHRKDKDPLDRGIAYSMFSYHCAKFYLATGNRDGVLRVLDARLNEGIEEFSPTDYEMKIVPLMVRIGFREGLEGFIKMASEAPEISGMSWENPINKAKRALAGEPLNGRDKLNELRAGYPALPPEYDKIFLEELRLRETVQRYLNDLVQDKKWDIVKKGYEDLSKGKIWSAYDDFMVAAHPRGLIAIGDFLLKNAQDIRDAGYHARHIFLTAAMYPADEDMLPPVANNRKLLK